MSNKEKQELQNKILELENYVKESKQNIIKAEKSIENSKESIQQCEKVIQALKDIAWDKESKKESSQMYNVLQANKEFTEVKSNVGNIRVDKDFMQKQTQKHLDNPNLRGMISSQEMLSFPKMAKSVEAEYSERTKDYTWKAKADDGNILRYGSRKYQIEGKDINRLLTNYSETEYGERQDRGEQGQLRREFNDRDFLRPTENIIPQNQTDDENTLDSQTIQSFKPDSSLEEQLQILESNQSKINNMKENFSLSQNINKTKKIQIKGKTNASIYRRKTRTWQGYR